MCSSTENVNFAVLYWQNMYSSETELVDYNSNTGSVRLKMMSFSITGVCEAFILHAICPARKSRYT